mmetsp:Transcript_6639/g.25632  ORF Transcript_6639/g.25632 Transcript_6639/m.25632 type:complete len:246 (-) Transcript_6639:301-1038(-)
MRTPCDGKGAVDLGILCVLLAALFMLVMAPQRGSRRDRRGLQYLSDAKSPKSKGAQRNVARRRPRQPGRLAQILDESKDEAKQHQRGRSWDTASSSERTPPDNDEEAAVSSSFIWSPPPCTPCSCFPTAANGIVLSPNQSAPPMPPSMDDDASVAESGVSSTTSGVRFIERTSFASLLQEVGQASVDWFFRNSLFSQSSDAEEPTRSVMTPRAFEDLESPRPSEEGIAFNRNWEKPTRKENVDSI